MVTHSGTHPVTFLAWEKNCFAEAMSRLFESIELIMVLSRSIARYR